jgi:hypothetical protein
MPSPARPRHSCRAVALATAISCLAGCSTTHVLHLRDPDAASRINETFLSPGTIAEIAPIPGVTPPALKYDVVAPATGGLLVSDGSGAPMFARDDQIERIETIDRLRGARDGALLVGVPSFLVGLAAGILIAHSSRADTSGPRWTVPGAAYELAGAFAVIGVLGGALYGAVAGHRDIYIVQP